ncbi:thiol reductant ABC exporter subunit CydC [Mycobacteroides abscessus]|uniref:thiol reductant ABC exporter subunit CydC n=1 Tax=Mycobacteroides abscessus TaxID=36809 RepID=UPI000C25FBC1|nr:thiol reductant ABC exporter subunit CydC [Mycobacteroides abscessus]MBE5460100.1 thiol reductant ABC exporter, CydC subunit [Mycobacteroides abscessus]QOF43453.1 thiol reductant ABC exporter, CydC subunit [Mycobacteroides abscessus]QOF48151.1 thiol reductant ABC exporter, CydC subunit [Mycobacteroides abscessus]
MPRTSDPLRHWLFALHVRPARLAMAVMFGVLALGSALGLAGLSAWLITRAWQMPPVLDLSVAVVAVRALGISRGIWRYCERLAGHDIALRGAATVRTHVYARLTGGPAGRLRKGAVLERIGTDIDELAETVVRSIIPAAVAAVLGIAATAVIALISIPAAAVMACALLVADVLAPALAARAARARETRGARARALHSETAVEILDHAPELRVGGLLPHQLEMARRRRREWAAAQDQAAAPAAWSAAVPTIAVGMASVGALAAAVELANHVAPTTLAILVLLPLAAFEASTALTAAAVGIARSRASARHLHELASDSQVTEPVDVMPPSAAAGAAVECSELHWHTGNSISGPLSFRLPAGARMAVTGASGIGKTSLLTTLAGLTRSVSGTIRIHNDALADLPAAELPGLIRFFAEDAHLFATTVRDNLLVARGDAPDGDLVDALSVAGLGPWLESLPQGLDTMMTAGAGSVSGGQRRRILLARALLSQVPVLLLDEPTEHLDGHDSDSILRKLLNANSSLLAGRTVVVATHHLPDSVTCLRIQLGDTVQV